MSSSFPNKNAARGFTLIEVAIVLGVFAIIIAGIWMLVGVLYEKAREHNASLQAQTIIRNARQLYGRVGELSNAPGDYTLTFDQQNIFPQDMKVTNTADGKINHPWSTSSSGTVTIFAGYADANGEKTQFDIHYASLPKKACVAMINNLPNGQVTGLIYVKINSGACYGTDPSCTKQLPIDLTTATTECSVADNMGRGSNDVLFRMSLH